MCYQSHKLHAYTPFVSPRLAISAISQPGGCLPVGRPGVLEGATVVRFHP
jgi:hypothetical protein